MFVLRILRVLRLGVLLVHLGALRFTLLRLIVLFVVWVLLLGRTGCQSVVTTFVPRTVAAFVNEREALEFGEEVFHLLVALASGDASEIVEPGDFVENQVFFVTNQEARMSSSQYRQVWTRALLTDEGYDNSDAEAEEPDTNNGDDRNPTMAK